MADYEADVERILRALAKHHNVLLSGPPGTGKTRLLQEVAATFPGVSAPPYVVGALVPIPAAATAARVPDWFPSPNRSDRRVFRTVFDQTLRQRDFLRGLVPVVTGGSSGAMFEVSKGVLYRASEHGKLPDGAALLIIDEINRGPAVKLFGGSIAAIESDKRLADNGSRLPNATVSFTLMNDDGAPMEYELPHHLYILAAMNQADTSVAPLDVAFLRRWFPVELPPETEPLREYFDLASHDGTFPDELRGASDLYAAAVDAWTKVNERIRLSRGRDFQIGHGVLMGIPKEDLPTDSDEAADVVRFGWSKIRAHVNELYYGDVQSVAAILAADADPNHPIRINVSTFAGAVVSELIEPNLSEPQALYDLLRSVAYVQE